MSPKKCIPLKKMLFAIILLVLVEQGFSLKCYVCESKKDGDCGKDLKDELKKECGDSPTTPIPSTPEPSTPEPSTPEPSTPEPSTPEPSTPVPSTPVPSTPEPSTPVPSTPVPSTPEPSTPVPSTPEPSTLVPSTPDPTTPVPSTLEPSTLEPAVTPAAVPVQKPEISNKPVNSPRIAVYRVRRQSELKARGDSEYVCYKYDHTENSETKTSRGCAKKADFKCEGKSECKTCSEDGCNSASLANLGILSIILPIIFTVTTFLNR
ncbi:gamete and mating-type specific protein A-like [Leptopilina heterotoma]|uniref:gamete and mating-type specific protein A-like n=1 Tax=Leptopilina heterotoma TaxID=63436 RepID=UPI001CA977CB|nr:gamete and mating-type specific protein A-like [Leptopilina heterotoma]